MTKHAKTDQGDLELPTITEHYAEGRRQGASCFYHLDDGDEWFVTGIYRTRDSGILENCNFEAAVKQIEKAGGELFIDHAGHWACGWLDSLCIKVGDEIAYKEVTDILACLADYPILDDEAVSEAETKDEQEQWEDFGAREFKKSLLKNISFESEEEKEAYSDELDELEPSDLWDLYIRPARGRTEPPYCDQYPVRAGEDVRFETDMVAEALTQEELDTFWVGYEMKKNLGPWQCLDSKCPDIATLGEYHDHPGPQRTDGFQEQVALCEEIISEIIAEEKAGG